MIMMVGFSEKLISILQRGKAIESASIYLFFLPWEKGGGDFTHNITTLIP